MSAGASRRVTRRGLQTGMGVTQGRCICGMVRPLNCLGGVVSINIRCSGRVSLKAVVDPRKTVSVSAGVSASLRDSANGVCGVGISVKGSKRLARAYGGRVVRVSSGLSSANVRKTSGFKGAVRGVTLSIGSNGVTFRVGGIFTGDMRFSVMFDASSLLPRRRGR